MEKMPLQKKLSEKSISDKIIDPLILKTIVFE
jgi:hypothetical protein